LVAVSTLSKALYMPLSIASSVSGGLLAGALFTQIWKRVKEPDQEPPDPKDLDRSGREALAAAALQGLVFGLVRAAVDRATAHGYRAVTQQSPK
jgi:hypothetical protein